MQYGKFMVSEKTLIKRIKAMWVYYKICEGCDAMIEREDSVCPVCRSYRFDEGEERIIERSLELYNRYKNLFSGNGEVLSEYIDLNADLEI